MKIKTDFVTNSSSTSFILIVKDKFDKDDFVQCAGILDKSHISFLFEKLYYKISASMKKISKYEVERLPLSIRQRVAASIDKGYNVYSGTLNSDGDDIEAFFCMDSFVMESENIYLNYTECGW